MRNRRVIALVAVAILLLCRLPAYALEGAEGRAAAFLDSGSVGTETVEPGVREGYDPLAQLPAHRQPDRPVEIVLTEDWIVEDEQGLTTLSPRLASMPPSETAGILGHPGITQPVAIHTNGHRIVVKAGGTLSLNEFDANSAELRVEGEREDGLFYVERGGKLVLNQVRVQTGGVAVYLEDGADYAWAANNRDYPAPRTAGEAAPLAAVELYAAPEPLLVFDDTAWSDQLPAALPVFCSVDGQREDEFRQLEVVWDTQAQAGSLSRREDCVLEGWFPDGAGGRLPSLFTPELSVRFLPRSPVRILSSRFWATGDGEYFGELSFDRPHQPESVRLEMSEDGGRNWREIKDAVSLLRGPTAQFYQPDDTPRLYRIAVEGGPNEGFSEPAVLPAPGPGSGGDPTSDEIGGNRGGGTALDQPERELASSAPESQADDARPSSSMEASAPAGGSTPAPPDDPEPPAKTGGARPPSSVNPAASHAGQQAQAVAMPSGAGETPGARRPLSPAGQVAVAAAGIAVCGIAGVLAVRPALRGKLGSALRGLISKLKH